MNEVVTFEYEELTVWGSPAMNGGNDPEPHTFNVQVNLICTDKGGAALPQTMNSDADPGWPPEYEVDRVYLMNPSMQPVGLTETQFVTVFPDGAGIIAQAIEWACTTDHD